MAALGQDITIGILGNYTGGAAFASAERDLDSLGNKSGIVGTAFAAVGTAALAMGAAVAAGIAIGVKSAGDLEQAVANISTIKPTIDTSEVFKALNEMSTRIPQTASELGASLYDIFSSVNVTSEEGLRLLETFAKGAVGASTDAKTFGTAAMGVMNAYGMSVAQAGHISDVFFNTIAAGVVTGPELARGLGMVTSSAKLAGVSLDELGALIVGVTKEGGDAAQNINNLNNLFTKINTAEAAKGFADLHISTVNADGSLRSVIDVMGDLKTATEGMTESAKLAAIQKIFPDMQARAGATVIMDQLDAVREALGVNQTAAGATEAAFAKMTATFNSQMKILSNTWTAVLTTMGAKLLPFITPLVTAFAKWLPGAFDAAGVAIDDFGAGIAPALHDANVAVAAFLGLEVADYGDDWDLVGGSVTRAVELIRTNLETLATAWTTIRSRVAPIITALFAGDVKTAVSKTGAALKDFGTLMTGWLSEQVNKIDWAKVWGTTKTVATTLGTYLLGLAVDFTTWLGEQIGAIPWAEVWAKAVTIASDLATYVTGLSVDFATWLSAQIALIPWATVWAKAVTVATALGTYVAGLAVDFSTWLSAQVALIPWATVWTKAVTIATDLATYVTGLTVDFATWLGEQIGKIPWATVWAKTTTIASELVTYVAGQVVDFGTWLGAQVAAIPWGTVWTNATTLASELVTYVGGFTVDFATWLGAQVTAIPWAAVWGKVVGFLEAMTASFTTAATGLDWGVIITANKAMAQQMSVTLGAELVKAFTGVNWTVTGEAIGRGLVDAIGVAFGLVTVSDAWANGFGVAIVRAAPAMYKALVDLLAGIFMGAIEEAWNRGIASWVPGAPRVTAPGAPREPGSSNAPGAPGWGATWPSSPGPVYGPDLPPESTGPVYGPDLPPQATARPATGATNPTKKGMPTRYTGAWEAEAYAAAQAVGIDPIEFVEQIREESNGNPNAYNAGSGATGIAQIVPRFHPGVDATDPHASLTYAAGLMRKNLDTYGDPDVARAAYNAGPGNVAAYGGVPPFEETQRYNREIKERAEAVRAEQAASGGPSAAPATGSAWAPTPPGPTVTYTDQWGNSYTVPEQGFNDRATMPGGNNDVTVTGRSSPVAPAVGAATKPPVGMSNFGQSQAIGNQFELGLPMDSALAACGPAAVALFMAATGRTPNAKEVMAISAKNGWTAAAGMGGFGAFQGAISDAGINAAVIPTSEAGASAASGHLTAISTGGGNVPLSSGHYFAAQGFDPTTGKFDLGETGGPDPNDPNAGHALKGGSRFMTMEEITALAGPVNGVLQLLDQVPITAEAAAGSLPPIADNLALVGDSADATAPLLMKTDETFTALATNLPANATLMSDGVTEQFNLMGEGTLLAVTGLGDAVMTTTTDMAGNAVTTFTDMNGQVIDQTATMASGVTLSMGDMAAGVTTTVTDMGGTIQTVVTDTAGNAVTTITDMQGQVVGQFVTMQGGATTALSATGASAKTEFGNVSTAATSIIGPVKQAGDAIVNIPQANMQDTVRQFGAATSAAQAYTKALVAAAKASEDMPGSFGGSKSGSGKSSGLGKASGGPVSMGQGYLIGEEGPEFFVPGQNGVIIPNHAISSGGTRGSLYGGGSGGDGGTTIVVNVHVEGSVHTEQDLVDAVRAGLIDIGRRNGGIDVLAGGN